MISLILLLIIIFLLSAIRKKSDKKNFLVFPRALCINLLILEILSYGILLYLINSGNAFVLIGNQKILDKLIKIKLINDMYVDQNSHNKYFIPDKHLGYTLGKNRQHQVFYTNNDGLRGKKDYELMPPADKLRVAVFGDSFVFGDGERIENTWPFILEKSWKNLEIINFGVSGYGLGQSYMRFLRDGLKYQPDVVFFNYIKLGPRDIFDPKVIIEKDFLKRSTAYRIHYGIIDGKLHSKVVSPLDLFNEEFRQKFIYKPLAIDINQSIWSSKVFSVLNTGVLIKHIALKKEIDSAEHIKSEHDFFINLKLLENLIKEAEAINAKVIFFCPFEITDLAKGIQQLLSIHRENIVYIHSEKQLQIHMKHYNHKVEDLLNPTNHYNPQGHLIYAVSVGSILKNYEWGYGNRRFKFNEQTESFNKF